MWNSDDRVVLKGTRFGALGLFAASERTSRTIASDGCTERVGETMFNKVFGSYFGELVG